MQQVEEEDMQQVEEEDMQQVEVEGSCSLEEEEQGSLVDDSWYLVLGDIQLEELLEEDWCLVYNHNLEEQLVVDNQSLLICSKHTMMKHDRVHRNHALNLFIYTSIFDIFSLIDTKTMLS